LLRRNRATRLLEALIQRTPSLAKSLGRQEVGERRRFPLRMRVTPIALSLGVIAACSNPAPTLVEAPRLLGRVVDTRGVGLAGITVQPHSGLATRWRCAATQTDADGRFTVPCDECGTRIERPDGPVALVGVTFEGTTYACVDGLSWWDVEVPCTGKGTLEREFVCAPGGSLDGRVVDARTGAPLALSLRLYTGTADRTGFFRWFESGADGRFHEIGLAPGDYTIDVNSPNERYPVLGRRRVEAERAESVELSFSRSE
jgi:hypothetical protein